MKIKRRKYTEKEVAFIKKWYGRKTYKRIAKSLRRTPNAVRNKIINLGLEKIPLREPNWSDEEKRTLTFFYGQEPVCKIAERLGRTVMAVNQMIYRMKLDASKKIDKISEAYPVNRKGVPKIFWTPNMISYLKREYPTTKNDDISSILNMSVSSIHRKARELHLKKDPSWERQMTLNAARMARIVNMTRHNSGQWQYRTDQRGKGFIKRSNDSELQT